jgi:hypothetical protein
MKALILTTLIVFALTTSALAWNHFGHLTVAAIAYDHLTPKVRTTVDALLKLNPSYKQWVAGVAAQDKRKVAFMRAATWPDLIKTNAMGYQNDGERPTGPDAARNIGYADKLMHRYWHFIDRPFSPDHAELLEPDSPNAQTQIAAFRATLTDPHASKELKSYDLVWLLHLVGDVHQPLHATSRFDQQQPKGDRGGNAVKLCTKPTSCEGKLHAFWDDVLSTSDSYKTAITKAKALTPADAQLAAIPDEAIWIEESFQAAQQTVYAAPVGVGEGPYTLDTAYKTAARELAERRIALAGRRLANLLNDAMK